MKKFKEYLAEQQISVGLREFIVNVINRFSHLEPKDIEDSKDVLIDLQKLLDDKLTGI